MAAVPARPTSSRQARRAAARAADRATRAQPTPPVVARTIRSLPLASNILWGSVLLALLAFTATNIVRKITWYLAVDQFGYLVFAHDLLHGHVLHHWPPLDALIGRLPPRADILAQTYVADGARAYCRYSPGFPILLAAWLRIFGDDGAHYLNPSIFMALLVLLVAFGQRRRWRWSASSRAPPRRRPRPRPSPTRRGSATRRRAGTAGPSKPCKAAGSGCQTSGPRSRATLPSCAAPTAT